MSRLILVLLMLSGCATLNLAFVDYAVVNKCIESGGCWDFTNNFCERVDLRRCPGTPSP